MCSSRRGRPDERPAARRVRTASPAPGSVELTARRPLRSSQVRRPDWTILSSTLSQRRAADDDPRRAQVDVQLRDRARRATRAADADGDRHLGAEDLGEDSPDRISVEPLHQPPPVAPKRSVLMRRGSCPSSTRATAADSTKPVDPQTKTAGRCEGSHATSRISSASILREYPSHPGGCSRVSVRKSLKPVVPPRQLLELRPVDDLLEPPRRIDEARRRPVARGRAVADHGHQRHDPGTPGDEKQRLVAARLPDEVAADRAAHLDLVALAQLFREIGRDLPVVEHLDGDRDRLTRRRGDRVAPLCLVAVLGRQAHVEVLSGAVSGPTRHVEDDGADARSFADEPDDLGDEPGQSPQYRCSRQGSP